MKNYYKQIQTVLLISLSFFIVANANSKSHGMALETPIITTISDSKEEYLCDEEESGTASAYIETSLKYPEITGLLSEAIERKVNDHIKTAVEWLTPSYEASLQLDYKIVHQSRDLIGILFDAEIFPCLGNHEFTWFETLNIDLNTGDLIMMKDLFKNDFSKTLNTAFTNSVNKQYPDNSYFGRSCTDDNHSYATAVFAFARNFCLYVIEKDQFYFDGKSLYIVYDTYEITSASGGEPIIEIPISEIKSIIKAGGALDK